MQLTLIRDTATAEYTQGVLALPDGTEFQTIERPWIPAPSGMGGRQMISCVPAGHYALALHNTQRHPHSFALVAPDLDVWHEPADVPQDRLRYARCAILIHVANSSTELEGCIGLGLTRAPGFVAQSADAVHQFYSLIPWQAGNTLTITDAAWH